MFVAKSSTHSAMSFAKPWCTAMERTQATARDDAMFPMLNIHETDHALGFELQWQRCKGIHPERSTEGPQLSATGAKQDIPSFFRLRTRCRGSLRINACWHVCTLSKMSDSVALKYACTCVQNSHIHGRVLDAQKAFYIMMLGKVSAGYGPAVRRTVPAGGFQHRRLRGSRCRHSGTTCRHNCNDLVEVQPIGQDQLLAFEVVGLLDPLACLLRQGAPKTCILHPIWIQALVLKETKREAIQVIKEVVICIHVRTDFLPFKTVQDRQASVQPPVACAPHGKNGFLRISFKAKLRAGIVHPKCSLVEDAISIFSRMLLHDCPQRPVAVSPVRVDPAVVAAGVVRCRIAGLNQQVPAPGSANSALVFQGSPHLQHVYLPCGITHLWLLGMFRTCAERHKRKDTCESGHPHDS